MFIYMILCPKLWIKLASAMTHIEIMTWLTFGPVSGQEAFKRLTVEHSLVPETKRDGSAVSKSVRVLSARTTLLNSLVAIKLASSLPCFQHKFLVYNK